MTNFRHSISNGELTEADIEHNKKEWNNFLSEVEAELAEDKENLENAKTMAMGYRMCLTYFNQETAQIEQYEKDILESVRACWGNDAQVEFDREKQIIICKDGNGVVVKI